MTKSKVYSYVLVHIYIYYYQREFCTETKRFYTCRSITNKQSHITNGNIRNLKNLKFSSLNLRGGLKHKKNEIEVLFDAYNPDILGITEATVKKLDNINFSDTAYNLISGFTYSEAETRSNVFVRKGLRTKTRSDIMKKLQVPCVWLEIRDADELITIINIYREHRIVGVKDNTDSLSGKAQFERFSNFVKFWERAAHESDEVWVLGDLNLDFALMGSTEPHNYYKVKMLRLIDERILSKGFIQLIKGYTWYRDDGSAMSQIDHIYTNSSKYTSVSNFKCSGSDHNMVSVIRKGKIEQVRPQFRTSRNMSNFSRDDFLFILNNLDLDPILTEPSPEKQVQMLTAAIEVAADITCPFVTFSVKKNHTRWMTAELKNLIQCRNAWFSDYSKTKSPDSFKNYKIYRNKVNREIFRAKRDYYKKATDNITDPREVWTKLDELAGRNTGVRESIAVVDNNTGNLVESPTEVAEIFNNFYQEKVEKIIKSLPKAGQPPTDKAPDYVQNFKFKTVNVKQVRKLIMSLSSSNATGHDGISNFLVKASCPVICPVLTRVVNNCIRKAEFPETWKVGKITVLHKKGEKTITNNYRPITLLCSLSKIIEKVMFKQILEYFTVNNLMDPRQYGFRPRRSCAHAVIEYISTVLHSKEELNEKHVNALLIDLSAAFDIVGHKILINKLKDYSFDDSAIKLVSSYLSNRTVYTEIENSCSKLLTVQHGVPQGSVLGPLLYIIYVNNLRLLKNTNICYADDLTSVIKASTHLSLQNSTNEAMRIFTEYFSGTGLMMNKNKTELINHSGKDT